MNFAKSVEVLVYWKNTVVQAYHFNPQGEVFAGNQTSCDIFLPGQFNYSNFRFLRMNDFIEVFGFDGQNYILGSNRITLEVPSSVLRMEIGLVSATQRPNVVPVFDWNTAESRTFLISGLISLYIFFLTYNRQNEEVVSDVDRNATVIFTKTFPRTEIEEAKPTSKPSLRVTPRAKSLVDPNSMGIFKQLGNTLGIGSTDSRMDESLRSARDFLKNRGTPSDHSTFSGFKEAGGGSNLGAVGGSDIKIKVPGGSGNSTRLARGNNFGKSDRELGGASGDESMSGFMDKEAIRQVIKSHLSEIRSCYEMKLNRDRDISGKLVIRWQILEGGNVGKASSVNERSSLEDRDVAKCTVNVIKGLRFPQPPQGMIGEVQYPFVFTSR